MNRRQLFLSTARAALATALGSVGFRKGAWAQAPGSPTATQFPDSTVLPTPTPPFAGFIEPNGPEHAGLAADHHAARKRAERAADSDR
jgi:hypothetical protein